MREEHENGYLPFPFFLSYATSLLHKHDIDVFLIDAIAEKMSEDQFLKKVLRLNIDYLVAETSIPSFYDDLSLLKKISSVGISVILCGPNFEIYQPQFFEKHPFVSFVLYGEYEFSLLDLVMSLQEDKDLSRVQGLIYRDGLKVIKNPKREPADINLLPWPHRECLPMNRYLDAPGGMLAPSVQMMASRGCPFQCAFCLWPQVVYQGYHYRARNVKDVADEMEYLVKEKRFKSVYFDDDTFNIGKERMLFLCKEFKERGLDKIQWAIMARPDLMDEQILENMRGAGLWAVKYGIESADESLIDGIGKRMDLKKAEEMIRLTKKLGIRTHLTFTFGLPGETKETIEKTIRFAQRLDPFSVQFSITTPFPGTAFFEELEKNNRILTKNWALYDGHQCCVFQPDHLSPSELEEAKRHAYRVWGDHQRKKRGWRGNVKKFIDYLNNYGVRKTLWRTLSYFNNFIYQRWFILIDAKNFKDKKSSLGVVLKQYFLKEGLRQFFSKLREELSFKNLKQKYLQILGIYDGEHGYYGPFYVQIDLTNRCNNTCIACWCNSPLFKQSRLSEEEKKEFLPLGLVKQLIDELAAMGTKEIGYSGSGEPFMHPDIMEILEYTKKKGLFCLVNTNFTLLDKEKLDYLMDIGVDSLTVSLWAATASTYVKTHLNRTGEDFYRIKENLNYLNICKKDKPRIHLYNVIFNMNYFEVEQMVDFAIETKSEICGFTLVDTIPGATDILVLNETELAELKAACQRIKLRLDENNHVRSKNVLIYRFDDFLRRISICKDALEAKYDRNFIDSMPCFNGWLFARVIPNGEVHSCLKAHRIPAGTLYRNRFSEIWNSSQQATFRKKTCVYKKSDPFFKLIGNDPNTEEAGCYKSCDDIGRNMHMHTRMKMLTLPEKAILKSTARLLRAVRKAKSKTQL